MIKSSYSYENNLLKEIKQIHKGDYILTKNYKYIDGKLVEFTELDPFLNLEKRCVYDYDEFTNLKSITEFRKYTDRKSGKITNVKISTFFSFNNNFKTLTGGIMYYDQRIKQSMELERVYCYRDR